MTQAALDPCRSRHGGADTSVQAWCDGEKNRQSIRDQIAQVIFAAGVRGMTCEEVENETGIKHQTASARISELNHARRIYDTGDRRNTESGSKARVYRWICKQGLLFAL